ncbi:hypothetical protein [Caballeronia sp. Lep1P3]|uniref:hypothetical protein n=1 Tax=Caballeronia sp. Lep1P3 TaxID=2878150 RepID=UPI001FD2DEB5|nr:hypothetical protein [Caballeronia sp. Lep1P3]
MTDLAWNVLFSVSSVTAVAMLSCTIATYLELWRFHDLGWRYREPTRFRLLRANWFFYLNAGACFASVGALVYAT